MTSPVRLRISYKNPENLLGEFTRSVGQGAVALESRRPLSVGTRFVFELRAHGYPEPVEVDGEIIALNPKDDGRYMLTIRYEPGAERGGLDALLDGIWNAQRAERVREHARIPLRLRATEETPYSPAYRILDVSLGGMGLEIEAPILPRSVRLGTAFLADLLLGGNRLALYGEVCWTTSTPSDQGWQHPRFGVHFGRIRDDTSRRLEQILKMATVPAPPWKARVSFGMDAVSKMP